MAHFDLIIIGTGSGNTIANRNFHHKSVAIIEQGTFGGTCSNFGCIPTKMMVHPANVARQVKESSRVSVNSTFDGTDWADLQRRIFTERIDPIAASGEEYRRGPRTPNVTFFHGTGRFTGPRTVTVDNFDPNVSSPDADPAELTADNIVIATGGRPFIPDVIADSGVDYRTNLDIMRVPELPKKLTILGGGVVAVEFAHVFSALGSEVTIINRSPLLRQQDATLVHAFNDIAAEQWTVHTNREVTAVREEGDQSVLTLDDGTEVISDVLLVALGRVPNSDTLDVAAAGVQVDDKGYVVIDDYARTTAEGVWALGDAVTPLLLKHVANNDARVIGHNILHPDDLRTVKRDAVPAGIFTYPSIATLGATEEEAQAVASEKNTEITTYTQRYADVAYGWAMEDTTGFCKVIADKNSGQLLGATIMGPEASTLIQILTSAMSFGIDVREFAKNQYWPHPGLSEVVENALLGLEFSGEATANVRP